MQQLEVHALLSAHLIRSHPLNFRALKILEHFGSVLRSKTLMWVRLKFRVNFKSPLRLAGYKYVLRKPIGEPGAT